MKISIKLKLVSIFIVFFAFASVITASIMDYFINDTIIEDRVNMIEDIADSITGFMSNNIIYEEQFDFMEDFLNEYSKNLNAVIIIADTKGQIMLSVPELKSLFIIRNRLDRSDMNVYSFPLREQYEPVLKEGEVIRETGYFYGLLTGIDKYDKPWLILRKGIVKEGNTIGSLYIFSPTPTTEIIEIKKSFFNVFLTASLISLVFTSLLVFIYSRLFIRPITTLKHASSEVAKGNYSEVINSRSHDEIGELALNFNDMTRNLERLEKSRKDFIANVSHELRSPMTSIKGFIDAVLDGVVPSDKVNEYLQLIKAEINRLNNLVTGLLDIAKFDSSELTLEKSVFDINSLLRATITKFEPSIIEKNLKIHANFQDRVQYVEADEEMIERVCLNLIQNSIKYTNMNGDVYIKTVKKKNKVYVSVIDNGQGIGKSEIDLIWDRFYKTDTSRGVDKIGVGLGLSIVKKIVDAHEETIYVKSEPNIKTEFTFTLNARS